MRARTGPFALVGAVILAGAAVLAARPGDTSAATAATWTVIPGGKITATAGKTTLADTRTGAMTPCASASYTVSPRQVITSP